MTPSELLKLTPEELAAFSDEQLREYFKPFFNVTRPSKALKETKVSSSSPRAGKKDMNTLLSTLAALEAKLEE